MVEPSIKEEAKAELKSLRRNRTEQRGQTNLQEIVLSQLAV